MFAFLSKFGENTQYNIFLYAHIPLCAFLFYYFVTVVYFNNVALWIVVNCLSVLHLIIHLFALKWKSNVFRSPASFIFIAGAALTGTVNLLLTFYYN